MMKEITFDYAKFNDLDKIRVYMELYPERVFTNDFMEELANKYLNYYTVRKMIKDIWYEVVGELVDNINLIPNDYDGLRAIFKKDK